jgi:hypothetical protein
MSFVIALAATQFSAHAAMYEAVGPQAMAVAIAAS